MIKSAFVLNDLNLPDFEGHRGDHRLRQEAARVMDSYKVTATHKIIAAVVAALVLVFSSGISAKFHELTQTKDSK